MTDHIGEATTMIDLDALEKLADEATTGSHWTGDEWLLWAEFLEFYDYGREANISFLKAANPATIKALIAELREAMGLLEEVTDDLKSEIDARYDGMLPQLEARYSRDLSTIDTARAFLVRNGKGKGQ